MTKVINGDFELKEDTIIEEELIVKGNIKGYFNLKVAWNINARNINARNINARNINAWNIDAWNIDARNINAWNIDALNIDARNIDARNINAWNINAWNFIFCESVKVKEKIKAKVLIKERSKMEIKEW